MRGISQKLNLSVRVDATVTYVHNNDGELTDTTDEDGRRTTYSLNADGDQTGETWVGASPAEKITYTYDADNEMTGAADSFATLTFTYNADGELATDVTSKARRGESPSRNRAIAP
jgi:YD repeat-containing protein